MRRLRLNEEQLELVYRHTSFFLHPVLIRRARQHVLFLYDWAESPSPPASLCMHDGEARVLRSTGSVVCCCGQRMVDATSRLQQPRPVGGRGARDRAARAGSCGRTPCPPGARSAVRWLRRAGGPGRVARRGADGPSRGGRAGQRFPRGTDGAVPAPAAGSAESLLAPRSARRSVAAVGAAPPSPSLSPSPSAPSAVRRWRDTHARTVGSPPATGHRPC